VAWYKGAGRQASPLVRTRVPSAQTVFPKPPDSSKYQVFNGTIAYPSWLQRPRFTVNIVYFRRTQAPAARTPRLRASAGPPGRGPGRAAGALQVILAQRRMHGRCARRAAWAAAARPESDPGRGLLRPSGHWPRPGHCDSGWQAPGEPESGRSPSLSRTVGRHPAIGR
jgi:hypothetical protein